MQSLSFVQVQRPHMSPIRGASVGRDHPAWPVPRSEAAEHSPVRTCGIRNETSWREVHPETGDQDASWIQVSRWKDDSNCTREHLGQRDPGCAVISIAMRATDATLAIDGERVHDGKMPTGTLIVTPPGREARAEFREPCDFLHLFVPVSRLQDMSQQGGLPASSAILKRPCVDTADPTIERLTWLFLKAEDFEGGCADLFLDGVAAAIVARLLDKTGDGAGSRERCHGLVKWRLKRVESLIEADISEPLTLADLARCAGLSRMHFAAQFRAATGMRPHEYVVRRRIQCAQEILRTSNMPLAEVALTVGFQTQAHFTTVFRRLVSETPGRWRQLHSAASG